MRGEIFQFNLEREREREREKKRENISDESVLRCVCVCIKKRKLENPINSGIRATASDFGWEEGYYMVYRHDVYSGERRWQWIDTQTE